MSMGGPSVVESSTLTASEQRGFLAASEPQRQWLVLRTRSRQEKAVAEHLESRSVPHYLPLIRRVSLIRGRKFVSQVPLFPGYVFLSGQPEDAYSTVSNKRVCQIIPVCDQARFIHELAQIRRAIEGDGQLELYPHAVIGRRCRVRSGPFKDMEGYITGRPKLDRLILQVDILGRGAALEIDADLLEPVDDIR